jgi:hypothetical protein
MQTVDRLGSRAALAQAALSLANLIIAVGVLPALGFQEMSDFADPAKAQALLAPLTFLELLKFASTAAVAIVVLALFRRFRSTSPRALTLATTAGLMGAALLFGSGLVGLGGVVSGPQIAAEAVTVTAVANGLGLASVALSGLWMIVLSWTALKANVLSRGLHYLGLAVGVISLPAVALPPLALLVLVLGLIWWFGLGRALGKTEKAA